MKKLTGNIEIELTDVNDGTVETYSETNMVTNAVNDILGVNPMGVMYKAAGSYDDLIVWNDNLLPICPNMIGGILLFGSSINEAADNLYLPSSNPPIAYASNDVNATANTRRGSLNLTESMALTNGYKFVWEFTASQGNGTIAAIGLISKQGGANAYGSEVAVDTTLLQIRKVSLDDEDGFINDLYRCVTVDFANGKLYSLSYASNTVTIKRYRIPVFDIGLNEKLDDSTLTLEDTTVLQCSTFRFYGSYTPYGIFMDGGDGYWYGFSNQGNSSGSATVLWIKIKQSDYSFTEGSWTLSNATLMTMGSFKEGSSYPSGNRSAVVRNGYLYVPSYDKTGVYKINISNSTDVTLISLGFTAAMRCIGETGSTDCCLTIINDIIMAYDFQIDVNDNVLATYAGEHCGNISTPFFRYKEYVFAWGGAYLNQYRYTFLLTPYLATISNLSQAVVKDASKTMKITYTLTENTV